MIPRLKLDIGWSQLGVAIVGRPITREDAARATDQIQTYFSHGNHKRAAHVVIGLSVRTIFDALLDEAALPSGEAVLMSGINIANMAEIVHAHDLSITAVDIDPKTLIPPPQALSLAQAKSGATICVVTQLFGAASPCADLTEIAQRDVYVVEDAAQAFAGAQHLGLSNADVTLFSFGPIKRRTALGGAVAVFRDAKIAARIQARLTRYPTLTDGWFRKRALKYLVLKMLSRRIIYGFLLLMIKVLKGDPDAVIGAAARGFSGKNLLGSIRHQPPARMIALLAQQITGSPHGESRKNLCAPFIAALPTNAQIGNSAAKHAHWLMPIMTSDPLKFVNHLRTRGFDATRGATSLRALDPELTPRSKTLMSGIVYVPNPADLPPQARHKLLKAVLEALK